MPRGTALEFYKRVAEEVIGTSGISRFDHTRDSYYRGARWLVVLRELKNILPTIMALVKARRAWPNIDLIHVNEITEIGPALLAKWIWKVPLVVHVRALVHDDSSMIRTRLLHAMLRYADAVIAIDQSVRSRLPADLPVEVIHNSFTSDPQERPDRDYLIRLEALPNERLRVGFVGNFLRSKGLIELIEAVRIVRDLGDPVDLLVVGGGVGGYRGLKSRILSTIGLNQNVERKVRAMIEEYGLEDHVHLLGPTNDIQRVYPHMDILAFTSHLDAPGRPVFEAAFYGIPSLVATSNPLPDTLNDGHTGLAIAQPEPALIADALLQCSANREHLRQLGQNAQLLAARNFEPATNMNELLELYRRTLA